MWFEAWLTEKERPKPIPRKKTRGKQNTYEGQDQKWDYRVQRGFISEWTGRLTKVSWMRVDFHISNEMPGRIARMDDEWWMIGLDGAIRISLWVGNRNRKHKNWRWMGHRYVYFELFCRLNYAWSGRIYWSIVILLDIILASWLLVCSLLPLPFGGWFVP